MSLPRPTLCLPTLAEQERWIRAMYEIGYRYRGYAEVERGLHYWRGDQGLDGRFPWMEIRDHGHLTAGTKAEEGNTKVNSIRHFVEYCKRRDGAKGSDFP